MNNQEASMVTRDFVNVWVSRFDCPTNLHSDKGGNLVWSLFKNMCKVLGSNRTSTTFCHPNILILTDAPMTVFKQIEKTSWPLPRVNDVVHSLDAICYFSNIDLTSGNCQMVMDEES